MSSPTISIRAVEKSDEAKIKDLFFQDAYHWTQWWKPILLHGVLGLFAKPILFSLTVIAVILFTGQALLALRLALGLFAFLAFSTVWKLFLYLMYFWRIPEFLANNLTELYSKEGYSFFVAECESQIIGCVGVQKAEPKVAEVFRMAVSAHCQRLGIGQQLLRRAISFARDSGYSEIVLETSHNQQQAIRFYEKNGFVVFRTFYVWHAVVPFCIYKFRYQGD